ncbi:MAG TPA: hypothetical protein VMZ50_08530 [Phycisphaerae bacterium]|nr:hypothetical protein [Phycisphaerae bacterium]
MTDKPLRVYADTSVFGGVRDEEFSEPSRRFFAQAREGRFALVLSALVQRELKPAPEEVRGLFEEALLFAEVVDVAAEAMLLQQAYLAAQIVSAKFSDDALHVATATVTECSVIVSWNFKHIVHYDKILLYNAVNTMNRYPSIAIYSPREVIAYEDQDL